MDDSDEKDMTSISMDLIIIFFKFFNSFRYKDYSLNDIVIGLK